MQPFKAPSLASSPSQHDIPSSPRPGSTRSLSGVIKPSSLKESFTPAQYAVALEDDTPPASPSDGERKRYSSSFSARRERRESFHGASRTEGIRRRFSGVSINSRNEEDTAAPGSVSSGSFRDEEEDVGLFLRMVEGRRELKSPVATGAGVLNDLDRFKGLKEGYGALGDSVSGSIYIPRASPPLPTSVPRSIGSGESPHTPVVRSRLSEGVSMMEETAREEARVSRQREETPPEEREAQRKEERECTLTVPSSLTAEGVTSGAKPLDIPNSPSVRGWGGAAQLSHHRATSFTDRLARRQQQDQEISQQILEDELEPAPRHSSSLGSLEGIPSLDHRRKSSTESAGPRIRGRPTPVRGSSRGRGSINGEQPNNGQGSLRERFCNTFAGEEGDEGEELLFAMSDMMGDKR